MTTLPPVCLIIFKNNVYCLCGQQSHLCRFSINKCSFNSFFGLLITQACSSDKQSAVIMYVLNLFLEKILKYLLHIWCREGLLLFMMHMSLLSGMLAILMIAVGAQKRRLGARAPARFYLIGFLAHYCCLKRFTASEEREGRYT